MYIQVQINIWAYGLFSQKLKPYTPDCESNFVKQERTNF